MSSVRVSWKLSDVLDAPKTFAAASLTKEIHKTTSTLSSGTWEDRIKTECASFKEAAEDTDLELWNTTETETRIWNRILTLIGGHPNTVAGKCKVPPGAGNEFHDFGVSLVAEFFAAKTLCCGLNSVFFPVVDRKNAVSYTAKKSIAPHIRQATPDSTDSSESLTQVG